MPNRLANESSPYLLQHAHNPVDWYAWGDEAIQKARQEDKPILVSIGYSACHWCHVMERESFEDPETAALMNGEFVNIKIDREERPDLDQIYMDAVQAIAGNGGWPLNVFLTPEGKPFFGGTYFPPVNLQNRPSWKSILQNIATAFREKRKEIDEQAEHLTNHIAGTAFGNKIGDGAEPFSQKDVHSAFVQLMKTADIREGGFGGAPKFPQTFSIRFLFQCHFYTGETEALEQACLSLDKMIYGGIFDQLGGGFARYSTDAEWLAPHFEKMLYDNALLISALSDAYAATRRPNYAKAIRETIEFAVRELLSPEGGFYSALDADSEGEEGKYYIWQKKEISEILGDETEAFCLRYDVSARGNWEGKNILRILHPEQVMPADKEQKWKKKLMGVRDQRTRPLLDDKILCGWNALMISSLCRAFASLGEESYRLLAIKGMRFLEENMRGSGIFHFYHSYKESVVRESGGEGSAGIPAFLDDYAYIIDALIQLQEVTGDPSYLLRARELTEQVIAHFSEADSGYFYFTHQDQDDVIVRKREVLDSAQPSGNSIMAANLLYLGTVFDNQEWKQRAIRNVGGLKEMIIRYPGSFGIWATLLNACTYQQYEIVLAGEPSEEKLLEFLAEVIPNRVFQQNSVSQTEFPLLRNKPVQGPSLFFLCRDYTCQQPVREVAELVSLLKNS
ncbi:MAG TPA: thioredoxin domain-containing protein [Puia sp.]